MHARGSNVAPLLQQLPKNAFGSYTSMIIRIGVWFDACHCSFGGPTRVLLNTLMGIIHHTENGGDQYIILLNEIGDYNWIIEGTEDFEYCIQHDPNALIGPLALPIGTHNMDNPHENKIWLLGRRFITPSPWCKYWLENEGFPFGSPRSLAVWPSGVDTEYFKPNPCQKRTQDFFVYFKSQHYDELHKLYIFLFNKYFNMRGTVITYYHYDPEMLLQAASSSRFCIMLDRPETQGLAALEIMSCDCPLFVVDSTVFKGDQKSMKGVTSVTCWDDRCGKKSNIDSFRDDFPVFLDNLDKYAPRQFVCESYSCQKTAEALLARLPSRAMSLSREETSSTPA